ncbi:hypothetical protein LPB72_00300 [Hydrogenophaga crassostreae]|uniref:Uncharacterized protein n=1 Tax=Hydrogenophaga crassostreae TaxID=1763535 RepID=A0A162SXV7_9BURK|nr:hypothetical protein LPB072_15515 [Hydrogenophaga crassostreae]OAD44003.1 hypothetical protein LPB72_00300 [Hydrogenophaga crassostreae]
MLMEFGNAAVTSAEISFATRFPSDLIGNGAIYGPFQLPSSGRLQKLFAAIDAVALSNNTAGLLAKHPVSLCSWMFASPICLPMESMASALDWGSPSDLVTKNAVAEIIHKATAIFVDVDPV